MRSAVKVGGVECALGDVVALAGLGEAHDEEDEEEGAQPELGLLQALWQGAAKAKMMQARPLALAPCSPWGPNFLSSAGAACLAGCKACRWRYRASRTDALHDNWVEYWRLQAAHAAVAA